ncbi:hypothetical protein G6F56_003498 [Rhizopus delemar]|nr:hypothetical protein G6F56_003498 [Rhizopus delemar]
MIKLPYEEMQESLGELRRGDWIDLHGPSGCGKTAVMLDLARRSIGTHHILFIDFDDRVKPIRDDRFHLFQLKDERTLSVTLACWLEDHTEMDVLWVMVDNTCSVGPRTWQEIKALKDKWGFVLLTSTPQRGSLKEEGQFRFELSVADRIQMQLVWPTHKNLFSVTLSP